MKCGRGLLLRQLVVETLWYKVTVWLVHDIEHIQPLNGGYGSVPEAGTGLGCRPTLLLGL